MNRYTVRFSALTDLVARVEVDAETPEQAVKIARDKIDDCKPDARFELCDNGIDPIVGTIEAITVDNAAGDEVLSLPFVSGAEIAAVFEKPRKIKVWAVTTDGDNRPISTSVHNSERDAWHEVRRILSQEGYSTAGLPNDQLWEFFDQKIDGVCIVEEHEINLSAGGV